MSIQVPTVTCNVFILHLSDCFVRVIVTKVTTTLKIKPECMKNIMCPYWGQNRHSSSLHQLHQPLFGPFLPMLFPSQFEPSAQMHYCVLRGVHGMWGIWRVKLQHDGFPLFICTSCYMLRPLLSVGMMMITFLVGIRRDTPGRLSQPGLRGCPIDSGINRLYNLYTSWFLSDYN